MWPIRNMSKKCWPRQDGNMKLKLHNLGADTIGMQLFDRYYAFKQSLNTKSFSTDLEIQEGTPEPDAVNIAVCYLPEQEFCNFDNYDFVFVDNAGHPLEVCTEYMAEIINHPKVYFVCGSFLPVVHKLFHKVIPYNHNIRLFHDSMTRGFYPQYYLRAKDVYEPVKNFVFINGANRSWRKYFADILYQQNPSVDIQSNFGQQILETQQCMFEDTYDKKFRERLNHMYPQGHIRDYDYYSKEVEIGINGRFGMIPPGYFLFDSYYRYHCVIFPESSWINNQHYSTEKIYKCFVSGALPFPISGAKTHQFYNEHGYQTAWNLLPPALQEFDNELDHFERYQKIMAAINWLSNNSAVFTSNQANDMRQSNKNNFYANALDVIGVDKLDKILRTSDRY